MILKKFFIALVLCFIQILSHAQGLVITPVTQPACTDDGRITVGVTGGLPPYSFTYSWTESGVYRSWTTFSNIKDSLLAGQIVTILVFDQVGNYGFILVDVPGEISLTTSSIIPPCPALSSATVVASGGIAPYSYLWSNGATTASISQLVNGMYSVLVTDQAGCFVNTDIDSAASITINQAIPFSISFSAPVYQACTTVSMTCLPLGTTGPYTFSWLTSPVQTTQSASGLPAGNISCRVTDSNGCTDISVSNIQPGNGGISISPTIVSDFCHTNSGSITLGLTGGTSPYSYSWSNGSTNSSINTLAAGSYYASVNDAAGCRTESWFQVAPNFSFAATVQLITPISCSTNVGELGVIVTGGSPPFSYLWNNGTTTANATGLVAGYYSVTITDGSGCSQTLHRSLSFQSPINPQTTVVLDQCFAGIGSVSINCSGGTAPYSYSWSTGATGSSITNLFAGLYTFSISDNVGCTYSGSVYVGNTSPIVFLQSSLNSLCDIPTGSVSLTAVSGGAPPYSYAWSNGATSATTSPLAPGNYSCTISDAGGCSNIAFFTISTLTNCSIQIEGNVSYDFNSNCLGDASDFGITSAIVEINSGNYVMADQNGDYQYSGSTGNYSIDHVPFADLAQNCQSTPISVNALLFGGIYGPFDYHDDVNVSGDFDNSVFLTAGPARPGFEQIVYVNIQNLSAPAPNQTILNFTHDVAFTFLGISGASPQPYTYNLGTRTVTWALGSLSPGDNYSIAVRLMVPPSTQLGYVFNHFANAIPVPGELVIANNSATWSAMVTGSFDPNDKIVFPDRNLLIGEDSVLQYTIRFQNTGTDTAFTVVLMDGLDYDLNVESFRNARASHPFKVLLSGQGLIQIRFENILLPPRTTNEAESQGYFSYTISRKMPLPLGTEINNTANIYFDFNEPIVTNTTSNIIVETLSREEETAISKFSFAVFPNPSSGAFTASFDLEDGEAGVWQILDLNGRTLWESIEEEFPAGKIQRAFNLAEISLNSGVYFLRLSVGYENLTQKIVFMKQ